MIREPDAKPVAQGDALPGKLSLAMSSLTYAVCAVVVSAALCTALRVGDHPLDVPMRFFGDTVGNMLQIQALMDGNPFRTRLDAPFSYNTFLFPVNSHIDYAMAALLGWCAGSAGAGLNLGWILKMVLGGLVALWALRRLGIGRPAALVGGILFGLCQYGLAKGVMHYNLNYQMVPLACAVALLSLKDRPPALSRLHRALAYLGCAHIGFNCPYTVAFTLLVFGLTIGIQVLGRYGWLRMRIVVTAAAVVFTTALLSATPGILAARELDTSFYVRSPQSTYDYGLRPVMLVAPVPNHPVPFLNKVNKDLEALTTDPNGLTFAHVPLGAFSSAGLVLLLAVLALQCSKFWRASEFGHALLPAAVLCVLLLLICTKGGFNLLIAQYLTPVIRAWERIAVFIGFLALSASSTALDAAIRRAHAWGWFARLFAYGATALLVGICVYEQLAYARLTESLWIRSEIPYREVEDLCKSVEARLPDDAMVYYFPDYLYRSTAEGGVDRPLPKDLIFKNLQPYYVTSDIRWSSAMLGRSGRSASWHDALNALPWRERIRALIEGGFAGIWVDSHGYEDEGAALFAEIDRLPGALKLPSQSRRYVFVDLQPTRLAGDGTVSAQTRDADPAGGTASSAPPAVYPWGVPVFPLGNDQAANMQYVRFASGIWLSRSDALYSWLGEECTFVVHLESNARPVELVLDHGAYIAEAQPAHEVSVFVNDLPIGRITVTAGSRLTSRFIIPAAAIPDSGSVTVRLETPTAIAPAAVDPRSTDTRRLGLSLYRLVLRQT